MRLTVSAREANQRFSDILGRAAQGDDVVITKHGEPVAQLMKYTAAGPTDGNGAAWDRLIAMMEEGVDLGGEPFDRDALYER